MAKKPNYKKAILLGAAAFVLMTLFWRFLGNLRSPQDAFMSWAWDVARKLTTWGFAAMAFIGGLK